METPSRTLPVLATLAAAVAVAGGVWLLLPNERARASREPVLAPRVETEATAGPAADLVTPEVVPLDAQTEDDPDPLRQQEVWTETTLFGRVLERASRRGLAEAIVRFDDTEGNTIGGVRTDEEGRFALTLRAPPVIRAQALPRRGFVVDGPPRELSEKERAGQEEILLYLARGTSAVVTGRVVNERTEEGVFTVRVELAGGDLRDSVETDGQGLFTSEVAFPAGSIRATVVDEPPEGRVQLGSFQREHLKDGMLGEPWELAVDVGPSYLLDSTSGPPLNETFTAQLVERDPEPRYAAVLDVYPAEFRLLDHADQDALRELGYGEEGGRPAPPARVEWPELLLRAGTPPWIRYPKQLHEPAPEDVPRVAEILVRGRDRWFGEARVDQTIGHRPYTLGVPLRAVARLAGIVMDTTRKPVSRARVFLYPWKGLGDVPLYETKTNDRGGFAFELVEVGRYEWVVEPELHAGESREVALDAGANRLDPVVLPPAMIAGAVSGELYVPPGTPHEQPFLTLASNEGSSFRRVQVANRIVGTGGTLYDFSFEDVPSGEYELVVGHIGVRKSVGTFFSPRYVRVYPPEDGLRFECRASEKADALFFRVKETGGEAVRRASVVFGPEGWLVGEYELRGKRPFMVPHDVPLQWTVAARGYRPVFGTQLDVVERDGEQVIEVELRRGWGARLHLRALPSERELRRLKRHRDLRASDLYWASVPLANAEIHADGRSLTRSDRNGTVDLALSTMPALIQVELEGWLGLDVTPMTWRRGAWNESILWLVPLEKNE